MTPGQKAQLEAVIKFIKSKQLTFSLDEANAVVNALSTILPEETPEKTKKANK